MGNLRRFCVQRESFESACARERQVLVDNVRTIITAMSDALQIRSFIGSTVVAAGLFLCNLGLCQCPPEPPTVPIGLDAFTQWERWPYQRIGVRAYMRGTYDRAGGNRGADASHFLYQEREDFNTVLDVEGPGILYWARFNHWHGSPWTFEIDGKPNVVKELATDDPLFAPKHTHFVPPHAFPDPLATIWTVSHGADLSWVPMEFTKSFRLGYGRTHYGTGCFIYHKIVPGIPTSHELSPWDISSTPSQAVVDLLKRSGSDIAPQADDSETSGLQVFQGKLSLPALETTEVIRLQNAPAMVRALEFEIPRGQALAASRLRLKMTWDASSHASIDAPLALFYGSGTLYNRDDREHLVKSFPMTIRYTSETVHLACYFPMPYFLGARLELENPQRADVTDIQWRIRTMPFNGAPNQVGYFHANYVDLPKPEPGKALSLLDTQHIEGGGDWSGHLVGNTVVYTHSGDVATLEGDPRFWFDESGTPQAHGGGTEEWGGGGSYWRHGKIVSLPFVGHPIGVPPPDGKPKNSEDKIRSFYRFLLSDLMPFGKNARIALEHGSVNDSTQHYEAVTYWYGVRSPSLVKTDELDIGSTESEQAHLYVSPDASDVYNIESRYEWGMHELAGKEVFPTHKEMGRVTTTTSEFVMRLDPGNYGVMLRRKMDFAWPNQRAEIFIADAGSTATATTGTLDWKLAGIWYTAGSDTYLYSYPPGELDKSKHIVMSSERRFRDDEFLVPRDLTAGRSAIHVRVKFSPVKRPLLKGYPDKEMAWSEIRYSAYCFVMPKTTF